LICPFLFLGTNKAEADGQTSDLFVLKAETYRHYIEELNKKDAGQEPENAAFPNSESYKFLCANAPLFDCPDKQLEKVYYYRWWLFRKHVKKLGDRFVISEFIKLRPICCPAGHHFYEGRWLRNRRYLDDYATYWFAGKGNPREYSFWAADACYARFLATGDTNWIVKLLPQLIANYEEWGKEKHVGEGLFWQIDDRDGMEKSAGGSGIRPSINSYMYGDAVAISKIACLAGEEQLAKEFRGKAATFVFAKTREAIGFIPWYFNLPDPGYEVAWRHLIDPQGFFAPYGPTTAERRDPTFMTRKDNTPWDGPSWPYSTTQALVAMANLLNNYSQDIVSKKDYFRILKLYTSSHYSHYGDGTPIIWEWCHPDTGKWYARPWSDSRCGKHYNHSGFCDLIITGLVGIRPQAETTKVVIHPLLPESTWEYFCLDGVPYHGRTLTVLWDRTGKQYKKGKGFLVFCGGVRVGQSRRLSRIQVELPCPSKRSAKGRQ